jgi:hypothetical protein
MNLSRKTLNDTGQKRAKETPALAGVPMGRAGIEPATLGQPQKVLRTFRGNCLLSDLAKTRDAEDDDLAERCPVDLRRVAPGRTNAHVRRAAAAPWRLPAPGDRLAGLDADLG